jgi:7-carboxy-7-deazaguanine synthase
MDKIKVSEIFESLQCEGFHMGVPSIFLRTFGCNFTCSGFSMPKGERSTERFLVDPAKYSKYEELPVISSGCDSYPSWDSRFKHLSPLLEIPAIVDRIQELLPNKTFSTDQHLILTGGEPLLGWQRAYPALLDEIYARNLNLTHLTFETNGTQLLSDELISSLMKWNNLKKLHVTFSVSAKLPCSGEPWEKAILPDRIAQYDLTNGACLVYLKFVVTSDEDLQDVHKAVSEYRSAGFNGPVYIMPEGGITTPYNLHMQDVAKLAMKYGYRFSPRLQITLFGNQWGT